MPAADIHGEWVRATDSRAAGGAVLYNPDRGRAAVAPALAIPANYFEMRFSAVVGVRYHLWVRLRAQGNATSNDSVHVQFSDSVDAAGAAFARIGTSDSAQVVLQNGPGGPPPDGWGWADNGWGALGSDIQFGSTGTHVLRVQQLEDGAIVDQVVLSPDRFLTTPPGPRQNDGTILPAADGTSTPPPTDTETTVLWASGISPSEVFGRWMQFSDGSAADAVVLYNPDAAMSTISPALANPTSFFETTFTATAGRPYHVWIRMRAERDSTANDSVHVQFSDSLNSSGTPFARIGTTSSAEFVLQAGPNGVPPRRWGWTDNGWGALGAHLWFATTGTHTIRVQQREDGAIVDQIVISSDAYLTTSPGARTDDTTILPASEPEPENQPPTVALTAPSTGATFTAPATITLTASASDPENRLGRVEFYAGTTLLGTDTAAPYSFTWSGVVAGAYRLSARAFDADGAVASSAPVDITVGTSTSPWLVVFTASTDHNTSVTSYLLEVFPATADTRTAPSIARSNLGKPTPNANGDITVDRTTFFNGLPAGSYLATVASVGSTGSTRSAPFAFTR